MFVNSPPALEVSRRKSVPSEGGAIVFLRDTPQSASLLKSHRTACHKAAKRLSRDWVRSIASLTLRNAIAPNQITK
jgi:hypothetical protein